ncbi:MAG TPA: hypothetical protein VFY90_09080, partial [Tepidiformaceae bacterium]|nr:hypothetical protein [Tepidiformaceae bacterium]
MAIHRATEPITADDETIRKSLEDAFLPALLPALAQITGDLSLLSEELRPVGRLLGVEQGGMTAEQQAKARDLAFEIIRDLRDGRITAQPHPVEGDLKRITEWLTGSPASDDYIPLLVEEL